MHARVQSLPFARGAHAAPLPACAVRTQVECKVKEDRGEGQCMNATRDPSSLQRLDGDRVGPDDCQMKSGLSFAIPLLELARRDHRDSMVSLFQLVRAAGRSGRLHLGDGCGKSAIQGQWARGKGRRCVEDKGASVGIGSLWCLYSGLRLSGCSIWELWDKSSRDRDKDRELLS